LTCDGGSAPLPVESGRGKGAIDDNETACRNPASESFSLRNNMAVWASSLFLVGMLSLVFDAAR